MKKMDIIEFLKEESAKFQKGFKRVSDRKYAWNDFEKKAVSRFESICTEARTQELFEYLYVDHSKKHEKAQIKPPSFVTLLWGNHPIGETDFREKTRIKLITEGGCALHYVQFPSGEVAVIFYPFRSELRKPSKKYYVYKIFSSPAKITDSDLQKHIKLMFSYAHYSSFLGMSSFNDWCQMKWLQIRSKMREIWHSDWIEFMFNQVQNVLESQIEELAKLEGE
jgi:hypothetical protein